MNKQTPEYIGVRTEIAKKYCGHDSKIGFILADRILAIKGIAILANGQKLPDEPEFYKDWGGESGRGGYRKSRKDMLTALQLKPHGSHHSQPP